MCEPTARVEVEKVATPALTVAVKVTAWPEVEGLSEETRRTVVASLFTTWCKGDEALNVKSAPPL